MIKTFYHYASGYDNIEVALNRCLRDAEDYKSYGYTMKYLHHTVTPCPDGRYYVLLVCEFSR